MVDLAQYPYGQPVMVPHIVGCQCDRASDSGGPDLQIPSFLVSVSANILMRGGQKPMTYHDPSNDLSKCVGQASRLEELHIERRNIVLSWGHDFPLPGWSTSIDL